ncbi:DAK2 domain-containing protein [Streptomyces sp. NPDC051773]|uniref:DAK2 domain-containing protein n=1 Tax=Streptomyces sp. NPDC051773 TaxID=3156682 RepID=UPI003441FF21
MRGAGLDLPGLRSWAWTTQGELRRHRALLNALNVFPSPDRDTGTNMLLFWEAFACSLLTVPDDTTPGDALRLAAAENYVVVGNSVTITYRWLGGLGESLRGLTAVAPDRLAPALAEAARRARSHLANPVDGTMLTVFDAAAESAGAALSEGATGAAERMAADLRAALSLHPVPLHPTWLGDPPEEDSGAFAARILLHALPGITIGRTGTPTPLHVPTRPPLPPVQTPHTRVDQRAAPSTHRHFDRELQAVVLADEQTLSRLHDVPDVDSVNMAENPLQPGLWHLHLHTARGGDPLTVLDDRITVLNHRVTELRSPGTESAQDADGPRHRRLVTGRDTGELTTGLGKALADGADEILAVLVRADPGEALSALREARESREGLAAALIPCADERQAARAAGAFSVAEDLPGTVLAMFDAARTDVPGNGPAAVPAPR